MSNVGTKEIKEAVIGLAELTAVLAPILKDGVQIADVSAIVVALKDKPEVIQAVQAAVQGLKDIPAEAKDLDTAEVLDLVVTLTPVILKIVASLK